MRRDNESADSLGFGDRIRSPPVDLKPPDARAALGTNQESHNSKCHEPVEESFLPESKDGQSRSSGERGASGLDGAALLLVMTLAGTASGNDWTNPGLGDWSIASNWSGGVPTDADEAVISQGTALVSSQGAGADILQLRGGGSLVVSAHSALDILDISYVGVGSSANSFATVTGSGASWNTGVIFIGPDGSGTLRVESGARVDSERVWLANSITGTGHASATVTGSGSVWNTEGNVAIGTEGMGTLTLSDGGRLLGGSFNDIDVFIGDETGSSGSVTVTGAGSVLSVGLQQNSHSTVYVGGRIPSLENGAGTLQISSGGLVQVDHLRVSPAGSVQVNNGSSTDFGLALYGTGVRPGFSTVGGPLTVASTASGRMVLQFGGTVLNSLGTIGANSGVTGSVLVEGAGSTWNNLDNVVVGLNSTGNTLEVRSGGTLTSLRGFAGANAFSSGGITVSDPGSTWNASGSFFIGNSGSGSLQVLNGGVATTAGNSHLGFTASGTGDVNVSGAGSTLNVGVNLNIGGDDLAARGGGSVRIADGGAVKVGGATNLYSTGRLDLVNAATLTGVLNSFGGIIRTVGNTTLTNAVHLNAGGVSVETNNLDGNAVFSGNINGAGGLTKSTVIGLTGKGTLTLSGTNTYSGPTTVNLGTLRVNGTNTSATTVTTGTLGGSGAISGAVTIGNNVGDNDAIIAPGASVGTLGTGNLTLHADAVFAFELDSRNDAADQIAVTGTVSLNPGAFFTFTDLASCELRPGTSFTLIDNDGIDAIGGKFTNLAEGALFTIGPNTYRASYIGGTGNDLALTVPTSPFLDADFDKSSSVDGGDLALLQDNFGTGAMHGEGDADYDCDVDGADFLTWQRQIGSPPLATASIQAPEPASFALVLLAAAGASLFRPRRVIHQVSKLIRR